MTRFPSILFMLQVIDIKPLDTAYEYWDRNTKNASMNVVVLIHDQSFTSAAHNQIVSYIIITPHWPYTNSWWDCSRRNLGVLRTEGKLGQASKIGVNMPYKIETLLPKITPGCGEGPHWDDATQTLVFVDIPNGNIYRYNPATGKNDSIHLNGQVGFAIPRQNGGLVVGLDRTISVLDWATKGVTKLAEVDQGTDNRMNDAKCDPAGRLWAGTMDKELKPAEGALYCMDTDGKVTKKVSNVSISNGLAWSMDNKTFFFIDTTARKVYTYDYDLATGNISNRRILMDFDTIPELNEVFPGPDGMTIDTDGNLWVACIGGACMAKVDPKSGKVLEKVNFPNATMITSACWGGKNHDELYVTSLRRGLSENALKTKDSLAGSLFRVTGLGVKGLPATVFRG